jgi:opacity protein-like surface antigen
MTSVLARAGFLIDPADYIYAIGGYTYGRFELAQSQPFGFGFGTIAGVLAQSPSFGLNGGTIGGGWERQIAGGWSLRAEARYTVFQSKTINTSSYTNSTQTFNSSTPGLSFVENISTSATMAQRVSANMCSVWLGVAHYF